MHDVQARNASATRWSGMTRGRRGSARLLLALIYLGTAAKPVGPLTHAKNIAGYCTGLHGPQGGPALHCSTRLAPALTPPSPS